MEGDAFSYFPNQFLYSYHFSSHQSQKPRFRQELNITYIVVKEDIMNSKQK